MLLLIFYVLEYRAEYSNKRRFWGGASAVEKQLLAVFLICLKALIPFR